MQNETNKKDFSKNQNNEKNLSIRKKSKRFFSHPLYEKCTLKAKKNEYGQPIHGRCAAAFSPYLQWDQFY